jgi:hypothetical protein
MTMADKQRVIRHAEAPASAEEERTVAEHHMPAAAVAAESIANRSFVVSLVDREIWKWREAICSARS